MNIIPNSDSEQCTESRLDQVHSVHTPMAQVARTLPCRSSPRSRYKFVLQQATCRTPCRAPYRAPTRPCHSPCTSVPRPPPGTLRPWCLLSLLCACSACSMPAVCHNTVEPAVCLLSLLHATIQLSLLCACSACCVHAQPIVCHNTACCIVTQFFFFRKWAVAHSSSSNLFPFFFFSNPLVASLPLLKCSSLDHCNSYNSKKNLRVSF